MSYCHNELLSPNHNEFIALKLEKTLSFVVMSLNKPITLCHLFSFDLKDLNGMIFSVWSSCCLGVMS